MRVIAEWFWDQVLVGDGCWEWQGSHDERGRGRAMHGGRRMRCHRWAFELWHGRPARVAVLHHCDNVNCVRPDHVYEGTQLENIRDRVERGRSYRMTTAEASERGRKGCAVRWAR